MKINLQVPILFRIVEMYCPKNIWIYWGILIFILDEQYRTELGYLQSRKRRELADHIGEILGVIPHYLGVPTCNYQIGDCILECDGTLIIPSNIDSTALLNHLNEHGWESEETDFLTISIPRDTLPDEKIAVT